MKIKNPSTSENSEHLSKNPVIILPSKVPSTTQNKIGRAAHLQRAKMTFSQDWRSVHTTFDSIVEMVVAIPTPTPRREPYHCHTFASFYALSRARLCKTMSNLIALPPTLARHAPQNRRPNPTQAKSRNSFVRGRNRELMQMLKEGGRGGGQNHPDKTAN